MKSVKMLIVLMLSMFSNTYAQSEKEILGIWEADKKDAIIEIFKQGDKYFGKYI